MFIDSLRFKINNIINKFNEYTKVINPDVLKIQLQELDNQCASISNPSEAKDLIRKHIHVATKLEEYTKLSESLHNLVTSLDIVYELCNTQQDMEMYAIEIDRDYTAFEENFNNAYMNAVLNGKYDQYNAIITIQAGAGGTEACDFAEMLYRMYICYAEKHHFKLVETSRLLGDVAGIKSVSFTLSGANVYGLLKSENGVHRLIRISPFNANGKRQTSFASVDVVPELNASKEITIRPEDLKIDTFRSSGAGGQHINKTESAIRITHVPTGIIVSCQEERSQTMNKEKAMDKLYSQLLARKIEEIINEENRLRGDIKKIEWGSQIRTYTLQPYTLVKDHRTDFESGDAQSVLNGKLDEFISAYLCGKSDLNI